MNSCRKRDNHVNGKQTAQDFGWKPKRIVMNHNKLSFKLAFFFINLGVKILPREYRKKVFLNNCMCIKWIKVD